MLLLKIVVSGLAVGGISVLAGRYPALGGYVAVLPVITFLSLAALIADKQSSAQVSSFLMGALVGVALTSLALIFMLLLVRGGMAIGPTVTLGASVWLLLAFVLTKIAA